MTSELTSLQRAYLLGRSEYVPLGGVAMQEFREYRGRFNLALLERRLLNLAERYDSLRTVVDGQRQSRHVLATPQVDFLRMDLSDQTPESAEQKIAELKQGFTHELFDLTAPPWRVVAFQLPETAGKTGDDCAIFFRFDALILDGFSIAALMVELFEDRQIESATSLPVPSAIQPIKSQNEADANYWKAKLGSYEGAPKLPWAKSLETIGSSRYARAGLAIDAARFRKLTRMGAKAGLFRNTVLSAVILEVLSHWLSEGNLHVGVPAAPRTEGGYQNGSTFFAVAWDGQGTDDFIARAKALQDDVLEGLDHLSFSGVEISRFLMDLGGGASGVALPVVLTNGLSWPVLSSDAHVRLHDGLTQTPQVALDIRLGASVDGGLVIDIDHAVEAIERTVVDDILAAIDRAVTAICESEELQVEARNVLDFDHYRFNMPVETYAACGFLRRIADNMFSAPPENDALVCGARRVSYAELGRGVHKVLASLVARNLQKGHVAVLALPRSPEQTMVTLACALRGVTWVPVDASAPEERRKFLCDNCKPDLVVGTQPIEGYDVVSAETLLQGEPSGDVFDFMPPLQELSSSPEAAYYLYTSGTTGKPKCVVLSNRSTDNVIGSTNAEWEITSDDIFISVSPLHHDMSVYEVFGCLTAGGTLVQPAEGEEKDAVRWNQLIDAHGVTIWSSVPTIFEMLLSCRQEPELANLRLINQGGDYLKPAVIAEVRRSNPAIRLSSIGGPTETTIWSIWHRICPEDTGNIPYGRPLPANRYFVLNEKGEHCPVGVVGRIHSSGVNTALGYLEDGELRQHDFVMIRDEHGEPVRAFRSGDRGRYRRDGLILFDSRVQGYVKVRGVRISMPDVENELVKHPDVARVLLTSLGDERRGETELGALYEPVPGSGLSDADLRHFARQHLQESHVPAYFLKVDSIPLSANGKPDRRAARQLFADFPSRQPVPQRKTSTANRRLLDIYLEVVGCGAPSAVNGATDFLSMGLLPSHLKSIAQRISDEFGVALPPKQLLTCRNANQVEELVSRELP
ncbi:AMP-binding protein [Roseibium aggregatum]|uniref:AMP-binding protein n=1 Tax=Roseibium aggregatum TaxID=187304 RepID=UPI001A8DCFDD|nr:AMP-binding protein [Roseibium aggregatum]MBN8184498.1 AMP-binding protein [Roseibium aggregatum]UES47835.1 AMP-binding protein [Roseibium aggregatum]